MICGELLMEGSTCIIDYPQFHLGVSTQPNRHQEECKRELGDPPQIPCENG